MMTFVKGYIQAAGRAQNSAYVRLRVALCLVALLCVATLQAQLRVEVDAPASVALDEAYFQVRYKIATTEVGTIDAPDFGQFEVLAGPALSTSSYTSIINGKQTNSSSTTITYTLAPRAAGSYTIAPLGVHVGGHVYRSSSVTVRVSGQGKRAAGKQAQQSETTELRAAGSAVSESDLFVRATVKRRQVYEQEAIPVSYIVYERPGVGLNSVGQEQKPDFKGALAQEIPIKNIESSTANVGGRTYRSGVIQRYLLFPQQAGRLTIPAQTFNCVVMQRVAGIDAIDLFFNGGGNIGRTLQRTAGEEIIEVKALPQPKPVGFSGAVGQFRVTGQLLRTAIRTGEMATYRLTVAGTGNLKLITAPAITFPSDFDTYTPRTTDHTQVTPDAVTGEMVFDYTFVPTNVGNYEIPASTFVYFDPARGEYVTVNIPATPFSVKQGDRSAEDLQRLRALRNSDIRPNSLTAVLAKTAADYYRWAQLSYWLQYVVALLVFFVLIRVLRVLRRGTTDSVHGRTKQTLKQLKAAKALLDRGQTDAYYTALGKALVDYQNEVVGVSTAVSDELRQAWQQVIDDCNYARFAPDAAQGEDSLAAQCYNRALTLITEIDNRLRAETKQNSKKR